MSMDLFVHFTLSIYVVFLIVDALKAYKDAKHYQFKYLNKVPSHLKCIPLFLNNQKWSIVGIACVMCWVALMNLMIG